MEPNKEKRREKLKSVFESCGFKLKDSKIKADEYGNDTSSTVYFYWGQGKGDVNMAIDPRVPCDSLLAITGVDFQTPKSNGIRFGTAMKKFPDEYKGLRPSDPKSLVGRMFKIQESSLSDFLKQLAMISQHPSVSTTHSESDEQKSNPDKISRVMNSESNSAGDIGSVESTISGLENAMRLAAAKIDDEYRNKPGEDVDVVVKRRIGQSEFRALLASIYGVTCHVSGLTNSRLLIASHIVPWSKATAEEKTDPDNGLLLAVNWDAVFDKGFICFDEQGKVKFSDELDEASASQLGVDNNVRLRENLLTPNRLAYLKRHREEIFERWKKVP